MRQAGYSYRTCIALDITYVKFWNRYERFRTATKQVPVPPEERRNRKPMMTVPLHDEEEILDFLGVIIKENVGSVNEVLSELDPRMWDMLSFDDEDDGEE